MDNQYLKQRIRVCKALLSFMGYGHLWTDEGPTTEAKRYLDQYGGPMSNPQWILYQFIWYAWGRPSDVKVQEIMQIPAPFGEFTTSLLHAMHTGPAAIEAWLSRVEGAIESTKARAGKFRQLA